jgi:hypothetical protein
MAYQALGLGTTEGDGTGDSIRDGGDKINDNFVEIYTLLGTGTALTSGISATATVVTLTSPVLTGAISFADGSVSAPSITNTGDTNTGIFFSAADTVSVTTGGTKRVDIDSSGLDVTGAITATTTMQGTTITATTAFVPDAQDGAALGTTSLQFSDLFLADSAVIGFGDDNDTTLTHTDGAGLTLNSTNKLMFNDASQFIQGVSNTILDIAATDEIELTATLIEIVGNSTVSGTLGVTGVTTHGGNVVSDADSTDDLGTTGVRWANLFVDAITATDQITATGFTGTLDGILGSGTAAAADVTTLDTTGAITGGTIILAATDTDTSNTGSVTLDFSANQNFVLTFTGNVTLANPSTEAVGQAGVIVCIQDGTGSRTLSLGTDYETAAGGGITLSTAANAVDVIPYFVKASASIQLGAPQLAFS